MYSVTPRTPPFLTRLQGGTTVETETTPNPHRYSCKPHPTLPQGRATVEMEIRFAEPRDNNSTGGKMVMVLDGYNAPIRWVLVADALAAACQVLRLLLAA